MSNVLNADGPDSSHEPSAAGKESAEAPPPAAHVPVEVRDLSDYTQLRDVDVTAIQLKLFVPKPKVKTDEELAAEMVALKKLRNQAKEAKQRGEKFVPPADAGKAKERGPMVYIDYVQNGRRGPLKVTSSGYRFVPFDPTNGFESVLFDPDEHCTIAVQFDPTQDPKEVEVLKAIQQKIVAFASKHSKVLLGEEKNETDTANLMYPMLTPSKAGTDENPLWNLKLHVYPTKKVYVNRKAVGEESAIEVLNVTAEYPDGSIDVQTGDMSTVPKKSEVKPFFAIKSVGVFANRLFVTNVTDSFIVRPPRTSTKPTDNVSLVDMLRQSGLQVRMNAAEVPLPKVGDDDENDGDDGDAGGGGEGAPPAVKRSRKGSE